MADRKLPERAEIEAWETVLAERDRYREALGLAGAAVQWLGENYPAALRRMPTETFRGLQRASKLTAGPETDERA